MRTMSVDEFERHGIAVIEGALKDGPIRVVKDGRPCFAVLDADDYKEMIADLREAAYERVQTSIEDVRAGRARRTTTEELIREFGLRDGSKP